MQVGAHSSGLQIIQQAHQQVSKSSRSLAEMSAGREPEQGELVHSIVNLTQSELYAKAGAKVIQTENNMLGTLLDIEV